MTKKILYIFLFFSILMICSCDNSTITERPLVHASPTEITFLKLETNNLVAEDSQFKYSSGSMNNKDLYTFSINEVFDLSLNIDYEQMNDYFFNSFDYKIELIKTDNYEVIGENVIESTYISDSLKRSYQNNSYKIKVKNVDKLINSCFIFKISYDLSEKGKKFIELHNREWNLNNNKESTEFEKISRYGYDNLKQSCNTLVDEDLNQYLFYSFSANSSYGFVKSGYAQDVSEIEFYKFSYYGLNKINSEEYYSKLIRLKYKSYVNLGISNRRIVYVSPTMRFECNMNEDIGPVFCFMSNGVPFIPFIDLTNEELGNKSLFLLNYLLEKEYITKDEYDVEVFNLVLSDDNFSVIRIENFVERCGEKDTYGYDNLNIFTEINHKKIALETNLENKYPENVLLGE